MSNASSPASKKGDCEWERANPSLVCVFTSRHLLSKTRTISVWFSSLSFSFLFYLLSTREGICVYGIVEYKKGRGKKKWVGLAAKFDNIFIVITLHDFLRFSSGRFTYTSKNQKSTNPSMLLQNSDFLLAPLSMCLFVNLWKLSFPCGKRRKKSCKKKFSLLSRQVFSEVWYLVNWKDSKCSDFSTETRKTSRKIKIQFSDIFSKTNVTLTIVTCLEIFC